MKRPLVIGAVGLMCAAAGAVGFLIARRSAPIASAPIRIDSLKAELLQLDLSSITKRGPPRALVLRFAEPMELVPYHFAGAGLTGPQPIEAWASHVQAPVVFNAGQFDEELRHLGWLKSNGDWIVADAKEKWKALLVSGPLEGTPWAGIIDLEESSAQVALRYRHVVQSMMLVDASGRLRVRDTDISACRTVVAQDRSGRILVIVTEGATTLADLARWLPTAGLSLARVMNMDGGLEAQLAINTPELTLAFYGQYGTGTTPFDGSPGTIRYPLPAVIAVRPVQSVARAP